MNNSLVSVPVITYNSSNTILETLESIKSQTYQNIELIISDDCSTDNTVDICRNWIEINKDRFSRTELLVVEKNTGVTSNANRAHEACQGEWVKGIAGDDILLPNCIEEYMKYVNEHPDAIYVFSKAEVFGNDTVKVERMSRFFKYEFFTDWTVEQQLGYLLAVDNCIPAMALFVNKKKEKKIECDTRVPNLEDLPNWINLLRAGVHFDFIDKYLVKYRISDTSLCTGTTYSKRFQQSLAAYFVYYRYPVYKAIFGWKKAYFKYASARCTMGKNVLLWKSIKKILKSLQN